MMPYTEDDLQDVDGTLHLGTRPVIPHADGMPYQNRPAVLVDGEVYYFAAPNPNARLRWPVNVR